MSFFRPIDGCSGNRSPSPTDKENIVPKPKPQYKATVMTIQAATSVLKRVDGPLPPLVSTTQPVITKKVEILGENTVLANQVPFTISLDDYKSFLEYEVPSKDSYAAEETIEEEEINATDPHRLRIELRRAVMQQNYERAEKIQDIIKLNYGELFSIHSSRSPSPKTPGFYSPLSIKDKKVPPTDDLRRQVLINKAHLTQLAKK